VTAPAIAFEALPAIDAVLLSYSITRGASPSNDMWKITPRAVAVRGGANEKSQWLALQFIV
jgi:hypothetical protein